MSSKRTFALSTLLTLFFALSPTCGMKPPEFIPLNTNIKGTLSSSQNATSHPPFTNFTLVDPPNVIGLAEQRLFSFQLFPSSSFFQVHISTCDTSNFDTYLALFDHTPSLNSAPIAHAANDIACTHHFNRAAIHARLPPGVYVLLLTGHGNAHGVYQISLSAAAYTLPSSKIPPQHLDRIDQRTLPLDKQYTVTPPQKSITVYLIHTGVNIDHEDLEGRVIPGFDFVRNSEAATTDCTGQGTHAAALITGRTHGVNRQTTVISLRVFDCDNVATVDNIADAIHWSLVHSQRNNIRQSAVIALLFALPVDAALRLRPVLRQVVRQGLPAVAPAGDMGVDACGFAPAAEGGILTVGAVSADDERAPFSNFGHCVNVYAPGVDVSSAWHTSNTATRNLSGTAQAAAIATGAVSLLLALNPGIGPHAVTTIMSSVATPSVIGGVHANESALLTYVRSIPEGNRTAPPRGFVDVLTVLRADITSCAAGGREVSAFRKAFAGVVKVEEHYVETVCQGAGVGRAVAAQAVAGENEKGVRQAEKEQDVLVQTRVRERTAAVAFAQLEGALSERHEELKEEMGFPFEIGAMPWALDSRGTVYWGAPSFPETRQWYVTAGVIVAVVFSLLLVASLAGVVVWVLRRKIRKADEIVSMEGSGDFERGPVHFDDYGGDGDGDGVEARGSRSFRSLKKALSFRRGDSVREGSGFGGINRMSSFLGAGSMRGAKDLVRLQSFGGEAFAGMSALERGESMDDGGEKKGEGDGGSSDGPKSWRELSMKGMGNKALTRLNTDDGAFGAEDESGGMEAEMEMKSIGGEAFAMLANMPSITAIRKEAAGGKADGGDEGEENEQGKEMEKAKEKEGV